MTTFQQYQTVFVRKLLGAVAGSGALPALLDALPYYGDPAFTVVHRDAVRAVLRNNFPNDRIAHQPNELGPTVVWYDYEGQFAGYADAFFPDRPTTAASTRIAPSFPSSWWQYYAVAVVTDAARITVGLPLDTGKLADDLAGYHNTLRGALTNSVLAVLETTYLPTADLFGRQSPSAYRELLSALDGVKPNVNEAIAMGGDGATAACWFLYLAFVILTALGAPDVDGALRALEAAGLTVPAQLAPSTWWNGGFTGWFAPLSGPDLTTDVLTMPFPEFKWTTSTNANYKEHVAPANGYAYSLCAWGPLAHYKPQRDSTTRSR